MALTPAERQAARRDRVQQTIDELTGSNAALVAEIAKERDTSQALRAEVESLKNRLQAAETAALKAQVRELKKAAQKAV
jgi:septal ring factor EnvC (AmiA/AmiB activator)